MRVYNVNVWTPELQRCSNVRHQASVAYKALFWEGYNRGSEEASNLINCKSYRQLLL